MGMSKKDFIALANSVRHNDFTDAQLDVLARFCSGQNYAFKRERWLSYIKGECGPTCSCKRGQERDNCPTPPLFHRYIPRKTVPAA
jgi:hypothetical protein